MDDNREAEKSDLRTRAEERLEGAGPSTRGNASEAELQRLVHELQVHEIELKLQNEDLVESRAGLETALERYADFYEFAPSGFVSLNSAGEIMQTNMPGAGLLGVERSRLIGRPLERFIVQRDREVFRSCLRGLFADRSRQMCAFDLIGSGDEPVSVQLEGAMSADGQEARAVLVDISNERRAAAAHAQAQEQLFQARKMESVGQLAGGVAHDFNNSLTVIQGYADLALQDLAPDHPLREALLQILKSAKHSADLVDQLLAFARKQVVATRVIDLNGRVEGTFDMIRRLIGEDINLVWRPGSEVWPIRIDPTQLQQVLINLCVNARDAMNGPGVIAITSGNVILDEAQVPDTPGGGACGDFVELKVRDTGCGISREDRLHLFEPFYSTKKQGAGTGLGLATVYGIVRQNKGHIDVSSEIGQGTEFRIYLPRANGIAEDAVDDPAPVNRSTGRETILIVEDGAQVLELVRRMLESHGYRVLVAESPNVALRLAEEHGDRIDLLLTDVLMPEMNGRDLCRQMRRSLPDLRYIYMSGYTANVIADLGVSDGSIHFIQKPFRSEDLVRRVQEVLDD